MNIKECYEKIGANYDDAVSRFGSEAIMERFAVKFLSDESFANLEKAMGEKNGEDAFRTAHTLKGICLNLGFYKLFEVSSALTESLRGRSTAGCDGLFKDVKRVYENTVSTIRELG